MRWPEEDIQGNLGNLGVKPMSFSRLLQQADALYESAVSLTLDKFELLAVRQLGRLVGFDGAVWGEGHVAGEPASVAIDRATLVDRPFQLVSDYASIATEDPIAKAFLKAPQHPIADTVARPGRYALPRAERHMLLNHNIGHLALCGRPWAGWTVRWVTAYRSIKDPAFSCDEVRLLWYLVPLWNQAWEVCRARNQEFTVPDSQGNGPGPSTTSAARIPRALTAKQTAILDGLAQGFKYAEIASHMNLSVDTVRSHVRELYRKLGVQNRTAAVNVGNDLRRMRDSW
jgi:DNA-binding CsgD family transcriptional regulator